MKNLCSYAEQVDRNETETKETQTTTTSIFRRSKVSDDNVSTVKRNLKMGMIYMSDIQFMHNNRSFFSTEDIPFNMEANLKIGKLLHLNGVRLSARVNGVLFRKRHHCTIDKLNTTTGIYLFDDEKARTQDRCDWKESANSWHLLLDVVGGSKIKYVARVNFFFQVEIPGDQVVSSETWASVECYLLLKQTTEQADLYSNLFILDLTSKCYTNAEVFINVRRIIPTPLGVVGLVLKEKAMKCYFPKAFFPKKTPQTASKCFTQDHTQVDSLCFLMIEPHMFPFELHDVYHQQGYVSKNDSYLFVLAFFEFLKLHCLHLLYKVFNSVVV